MTRTPQSESVVVIASLRYFGIDPTKAASNPLMRQLVVQWSKGEINNTEFERSCKNMLIFNPTLKMA